MNKLIPASITLGGLLSLTFSPVVLFAADDLSSDGVQTSQLPIEIVITAGRKQQATTDTLAPVSVVTRAEIERSQVQTLGEVLTQLPGISLVNSGGIGKVTSVFLRGTESDHVLVLIDGVKVGSATLGSTAFEQLPLTQIDRIEVVRGPRSSLYGSEAIGGVIQVFTRQGSKQGFKPRARISYGSNNTRQADVNLAGGNGRSWFNFNAATTRTDGFNALDFFLDFPPPDFVPVQVVEADDDGFESNNFSFRLGHDFDNGAQLTFSSLLNESENEFDGGFQNESDNRQQVNTLKLRTPVTANTRLTAQVGQSRDDSDNFKDGVASSTFNTKRDTASLLAETALGQSGTLVYGFDYQDDQVSGTTTYDVSSRDNKGLFISYENQFGANAIAASVRRDDNEQFGDQTTGNVALGHKLNNGLQLKASYGTAFKAPTFNDLYFPGFGNPDIKPEESRSLELGISGELANGRWAVNAFENKIDDLISFVAAENAANNVDKAFIRGVEFEFTTQIAAWRVAANATLQNAENDSGGDKGKRLARRAEKFLNLNVDRRFGAFTAGMTVHAEGDRFDDAGNTQRLGGFTTVDLRGQYQLAKDWSIQAKIGNLLNKEYETVKNYNQDGVNGLITLEYQPQ